MHVAFYLIRKPTGHLVQVHQRDAPEIVAAATRLLDADAARSAQMNLALSERFSELLEVVGT